MIQLVRPAEPDFLVQNRATWTARWIHRAPKRAEWASRRIKRKLLVPLLAFSYGKCAFCEQILGLTSYIEIEHYQAKTIRPELVFDWQNLFPICRVCNGSKGELDHQGRLLKPDVDNPEAFLWLHPDSGMLQPHPSLDLAAQRRVSETIQAYGLQRGALCAERIKMMEDVNRWLIRVEGQKELTEECRQEWQRLVNPSMPLKFVIRHALTLAGQVELAEIDRQNQ